MSQFVESFNKLLSFHIEKGIDTLIFVAGKALQIKKGDSLKENPQVNVTSDLLQNALKRIIAINQNRSVDSIQQQDILDVVGGRLEYDILVEGELGLEARIFVCTITMNEQQQLSLQLVLENDITLGYDPPVDPSTLDEAGLEEWFNDFTTRVMAMDNPKPKDIVMNPNKRHPYLTVTGSIRPIKDVIFAEGKDITNRIAKIIIKASGNPAIELAVEKNNGILDTLDLDMAYKTKAGRRFRVNVADVFDWDCEHSQLITMRLLPERPFTYEELGLPEVVRDTVFNTKMGLVLIAGTTGSGKSTTMCAVMDFLLKSKSINLLTIEQPIETIFPPLNYPKSVISQREVGKHATTQSMAMQSAVRQTLNMAMVGEIRNAHDAMMAMELAQSGHLIFATLHAGSVGESISRIVEMFPADQAKKVRQLIADQYKMGLAQTLVKGTKGQTELVMEIMRTNKDVKDLITQTQEEERIFSMREILEMNNKSQGTQSYDQCLVKLFNEGKINEDIMMFNSPDQDALIYRQGKLGVKLSTKWDPTGAIIDQAMNTLMSDDEPESDSDEDIDDLEASLANLG